MPAPTPPAALNVSGSGNVDVPATGDRAPFVTKMNTLYARLDAFGVLTRQFQDAIAAFAEQNETDIANLSGTINLAALEQQIDDVNALLATVTATPEISTINGLQEALDETYSSKKNIIANDGSFLDSSGISLGSWWFKSAPAETSASLGDYLLGFNGANFSLPDSIDRLFYNSSTNGGTQTALSANAQKFALAMGRTVGGTVSRYAEEIPIAKYTLGNGTRAGLTVPWLNNTVYRCSNTTYLYRATTNSSFSFAFYILAEDSDAVITFNSTAMWINGVACTATGGEDGTNLYKLTQGECYHIAYTASASAVGAGHSGTTAMLYCKAGGIIHIAAPWLISGQAKLPIHGRLVPS